ncbi:MAG: HAD family hydrolase [Eubacteriales bacterium]|nr:HAD family hydrolase [uncultured Ruminococcus sp.]MDO4891832.1 HAD family hydrolase [Eubacteriales bacterium]
MYKNFLFDLDGTLLPMDMKYFVELYVAAFCKCMAPVTKIESKPLMDSIWASVAQMARNDGDCLNETVFWRTMNSRCKRDMRVFSDNFDSFYRGEFSVCRAATKVQPLSRITVDFIKQHGGNIIVATNPVFPKSATYTRINWAGLNPNDFSYITTYDNSSACKPNLNYFEEICSVCGIHPEESLMIGNDVDEDMISSRLGFDTFLVTDCLINRSDKSLSLFRHGDFEDLFDFIQDSYK